MFSLSKNHNILTVFLKNPQKEKKKQIAVPAILIRQYRQVMNVSATFNISYFQTKQNKKLEKTTNRQNITSQNV